MANKDITLAEANSRIEALTAEKVGLEASLAEANARAEGLQASLDTETKAHAETKKSLETEQSRQRNVDEEVALGVAQVASQSGVAEPVETAVAGGTEAKSLAEIEAEIEAAAPIEKMALMEKYEQQLRTAARV